MEGHSEHTCTRTNSQDAGEQHVSTAQLLTFIQQQQEREDQQWQDMLQIQQQMMMMFQAFSTVHTQQIAEERESRRLKETEQRWREEQRLEEETHLNCSQWGKEKMLRITYFEAYVEDIQLEKEQWITYLMPLLNKECRDAIMGLDAENRNDYDTVKEMITDQWNHR